ncbi:autotransporter domain-containing protein [Mesorhizobium sp. PAMC28654]|uniref:autotransporter outer membrane beta-barrel domain-containing protein n=1 Tax=Mesorhizobium sp. PAMC28654 TaxID=2880934 RepID=UPI001D0BD5A1|nr:autotransporter domain-containing protein [Mesorhizobium sp. PAMC28654]UDL92722.1 autotransporter domain-containing protein [Mesorhizobium sp. PAMC28654]
MPLAMSGGARAADVNVTANVGTGINLDTQAGSTAEVGPGLTVTNVSGSSSIYATTSAWGLTNNGSISSSLANTVSLSVNGSSVTNFGLITSNANGNSIWMTGGGSVDNKAGATISSGHSAIRIGTASAGPGTVTNAGTITQTGTSGDLVTLLFGGTVTNLAGGTISANNGSNAVSVGQGTSRTVINSGTITNTGSSYATGVLVQGGASTVTNNATGHISATFNGVYASFSAPLTLTNDGIIESTGSSTSARAVEATGGGTFINTGTIRSASSDGLYLARGGMVTNSGTISGAVRAINFSGNYARTLNLDTGSVLNGVVQGGTGVDSLVLLGTGTESAAKFLAFETLSMQGTAWTLNDAGTFATSSEVQSGTLTVAGILTSPTITVRSGGTLTGNGTLVGAVTNSGTVRVSSGALAVTGSFTSQAGSTLAIGLTPATNAALDVSGTATLNGGTVAVQAGSGTYAPSTMYTILTAAEGRSGTFDGVTSNFAFLNPTLTYGANNVYLTLVRNSIDFGAIGGTPNQRSAGGGVESLGFGTPIYETVALLDINGARSAFDQLSGEIHASIKGGLLDDSHFVRDAIVSRLDAAFGGIASTSVPVMAYGEGGPQMATADTDRFGVWSQGLGSWASHDSDGNAAALDRSTAGLLMGADGMAGAWRLGVAGGYSRSSFDVDDRRSSGDSDNYHLGLYGGTNWGAIAFRTGAAYAWHRISTSRSVSFSGFTDQLSADYDAGTAQAFGELAYKGDAGPFGFEPFVNLAYVNLHTDGFVEKGGTAALTSASSSTDATFTTLGVRISSGFTMGGVEATARGMLGWRHAFGDVTPLSTLALTGGDAFTIAGAPIVRDAALVELGMDVRLASNATLGLSYAGQFGADVHDNGFKAKFGLSF